MLIIIFVLNYIITSAVSQKLSQNRFWIPFTDKSGTIYSIHDPDEFLSERCIQRRLRYGIPVTPEDFPVKKTYIDSLNKLGLLVIGTSRWFNAAIVETNDTVILNSLNDISFIGDFNHTLPLRASLLSALSGEYEYHTPVISQESYRIYGISDKQTTILNGKALHDSGFRGKGMMIAVIDAGFYLADAYPAFDSLWLNERIVSWRDFAEPGNSDFFLGDPHGMSVLSTMGANIPGYFIGTAPESSYILLRSEVSGSENLVEEAYWLLAAEYADSIGADIINSSLGYSTFDDSTMNYSVNDMNGITAISTIAAEKAFSKGMIVVVSAGNEGDKPWKKISAPSDGKNVLAVGAIDTFRNLAPFSSMGPSSDYRIKPDIMAVGLNSAIVNVSGSIGHGSGTSYSAPQIAGLTACLWQTFPEKTNLEIIQTIRRSSSSYYAPDNKYGYGIPDFHAAYKHLIASTETHEANKLLIIPNPNSGIFEIRLTDIPYEIRKIYIYDIMGRIIAVINDPEIRSGYIWIDQVTGAQPGLYYIVAHTDKKDYSAKMIKQE